MTLSADERKLLDYIDGQQTRATDLLRDLANADSFSRDKQGVDRAGAILRNFYEAQSIAVETRTNETYGDALIARVGADGRPIVLMGHRDTVFPTGETKRRPFKLADGKAYGPGVNDMKAGLTLNAIVVAAFKKCRENPPHLVSLVTGDEELASPFSRPLIEEIARSGRAVFNAEPARVSGNVVTGRKGARFMLLQVDGKAAHSGVNFFDGVSAINELADKIVRLTPVTDSDAGTTLNIGLIKGGQTVNTVAPSASAELDLRFVTPETCAAAMDIIDAVVADCRLPGTAARLTVRGEFVPMVPNQASLALFEHYRECAADLGVVLDGEFTGSSADSGFASAQGVPTLCGVGAVGDGSHTPAEYIHADTLLERAKVLALAIHRLAARPDDA
jgi:glutamate carboxypeptidase